MAKYSKTSFPSQRGWTMPGKGVPTNIISNTHLYMQERDLAFAT